MRPTLDEFRSLAAKHPIVPVWAEVLADLETPVSVFAKVVGDDNGFLFESVEHGERWSRFSFVGRNPSARLVLRDGRVEVSGTLPDGVPTDRGILAAMEALLRIYEAPLFPDLPPLQSGLVGYVGYDVVREVENLPDAPPDVRNLPDAVVNVIGSMVAFDHWRQRLYVLESVSTGGADIDLIRMREAASSIRSIALSGRNRSEM